MNFNYGKGESNEAPLTSKYNSAVSQLYRIDTLWQNCHYFRKRGNLTMWNHNLDCIWTELGGDAIKDDHTMWEKFFISIAKSRKNKFVLNIVLMKKEIWLRQLQNKQGKGTAYADEAEDDFD